MVAHTCSPSIWDWETDAGVPTADLMLAWVYSESRSQNPEVGEKRK